VRGVPECLECGACCFSQLDRYVRVTGEDYERLGERAEDLVSFDGHRAYLRMVDGHCAALVVDVGSGRFVCSAYEARPRICRELERGSAECRAERELKSARPLLALSARARRAG
jgi:Fe-S-cluster containining protein